MGTKLAPALATIYIADLVESFIRESNKKTDLWLHYIDDIFMICSYTPEDLDLFLQELNIRQEKIKNTAEISTQHCNFLDLTIYKSPTFLNTGLLSTKICYKPSNTFSFPLGSSHILKSILRGIAIGEMTTKWPTTRDYYLYTKQQLSTRR